MRALVAVVTLAALTALAGCKEDSLADATCPPGGTKLTYADFGAAFFGDNCQRCHGAPLADRNGAPPDFDFGTLAGVKAHADRIYARAAGDNTTMPPGPDDPPQDARADLAEWLACGAPP